MLKPTPYRAARYLIVEDEDNLPAPRPYLRRDKADPPSEYWAIVAIVFILVALLV